MTETTTNPHQPVTEDHRIICQAPDCGYAMYRIKARDTDEYQDKFLLELFRKDHAAQYDTGRAPDIEVEWAIDALCSVCTDGIGALQVCHDGDAICCKDCGTHWDMHGKGGELEEEEEPDQGEEPDGTPDPTWETAGEPHDFRLTCDRCDYGADGVQQAMAHLEQEPEHTMTGVIDSDGTTATVSAAHDEED